MHPAPDDAHSSDCPRLAGNGWPLLLVLAAVQFTHIVDFMILMPLGPHYQKPAAQGGMELAAQQFGFLVAAYAFSAGAAGFLGAFFLDRFDRKHSLLFLYTGFTVGTLLCALAWDFTSLLLARCVAGAFGGIAGANILAVVGDAFPEQRRGLATGVVMSAFSVASIVGVPAGLLAADLFGPRAPFAALGGISAVILVLAAVILPPLRHHLDHHKNPFTAPVWRVLIRPAHLIAYVLMAALVMSTFPIFPYLAIYLTANVGFPANGLWSLYLCGGLAAIFTLSAFGMLADRYGKLPIFRILALATMAPVLLLTNLPPVPIAVALTITTLMMVLSSGRMVPAMALITSSAAPAYRGSFMSVNTSVQQIAAGLAALLGGVLVSQTGKDAPLEGFPLVGLVCCLSIALSIWLGGYVRPQAAAALPAVEERPSPESAAVEAVQASPSEFEVSAARGVTEA
jgi:predicted MFS family arabinose efflux permease